ncbi:MAG: Kelch repeat-containing protein [Myxococcaceae bacterium]|nr:Kelch repeat-containing protein [Myxococcaceae bacterium]
MPVSMLLRLSLLSCAWLAACAARPTAAGRTPNAATGPSAQLPTQVLESSVALLPRAVTSFGAAELGGAVYLFGGYSGVPHRYNREGQSGELLRLDPHSNTFELVSTSEPTQGAALVSSADALVRIGGMRARNAQGQPDDIVSLAEVAAFSPATGSWTALAPLPEPRSSHAAAVIGQTVYIVGGWQLRGTPQSGDFADSMLALDLASKSYRKLPQPFARRALAAAALDGKLVAIGGLTPEGKMSREVHVFDPASGSFSRAADFPVDGFGVAATSDGDTLIASALDGQLYALSEVGGAWRPVAKLALPRFFHQLVSLGPQRVLALGGISGMHAGPRIREVESIDLSQTGPRVLSFVVSNPLRARNRQGVFVHGDSLYVFGGNRSLGQHDFGPEDFVSDAARFDIASLTWNTMAPLPIARQTVQTLVEDDSALVLGGFGHDGKEARAHAEAYRYDIEHDLWARDPSVLPKPRTQFGLVAHAGVRWIFGGLDFKPEAHGEAQFEHPRGVLRAEPGKPFAPSGVELPRARRAFAGALLDGKYYLVGGMAGGFEVIDQCDVFDFEHSSWSEIPCPKTRISAQLVALDHKLYLAGGSSAGQGGALTPNRSLEVFDPQTNRWSVALESLPIEPRHLTMLPYENGLLLYSAHDEQGRVHIALIDP